MAQSTMMLASSVPTRAFAPRPANLRVAGLRNGHPYTHPTAVACASADVESAESDAATTSDAPRPVGMFLDEEEILSKSTFPIAPKDLITKAKEYLSSGGVEQASALVDTENFVFCAPVVGPIGWKEFTQALKNFNIDTAFPDMQPCFHDFRVDIYQPNRVWLTSRPYGTNTGTILKKPATNKVVDSPPQTYSLTFNEEGKVTYVTIGYVMDKNVGNTGGLGGIFGYLYAIGMPLPIPEAMPYKRSLRFKLFNGFARFMQMLQKKEDN